LVKNKLNPWFDTYSFPGNTDWALLTRRQQFFANSAAIAVFLRNRRGSNCPLQNLQNLRCFL